VRCVLYDPALAGVGSLTAGGSAGKPAPAEASLSAQERIVPKDEVLIHLDNLTTTFSIRRGVRDFIQGKPASGVRAVDRVSLEIRRGEIIGLVGESGSGKTTLGRTILQLIASQGGEIDFEGRDITQLKGARLRKLRSQIQMIFQDPYASLSPRMRVYDLLEEPYKIHNIPVGERYSVSQLLEMVGLSDEQSAKYPHELSGGQARRVGIARALTLHPEFLVADEPTAGLDVSVASSILNLMKDLAYRLSLTYLIITHNLNIVGYVADRVAVMYLGQLVEVGTTDQIFDHQLHPYTLALLSAISEPDPHRRPTGERWRLEGEIPSQLNPPSGCYFHPRCKFAQEICKQTAPLYQEAEAEHWVACHFYERVRELQDDPPKSSGSALTPQEEMPVG